MKTLLCLATAGLLIGCSQNKVDDPMTGPVGHVPTPEHLQPYALGPATAPTPMKPGAVYSPLREGTWTYQHVGTKQNGETIEQRLSRAAGNPQEGWRRYDGSSNQIRHLDGEGDGNVTMLAVEDLDKNVITQFAKAIPVMLTTMRPNTPITVSCDAAAISRKNPNRTMDSGTCTVTLTHIADQRLKLPAGTFDVKLIKLELNNDMKYVDVQSVSLLYYAENIGMVAEDYIENGRAIVVPWKKQRTLVITRFPTAE
jgi:hypothetical protein